MVQYLPSENLGFAQQLLELHEESISNSHGVQTVRILVGI